jgi:hypothetical protein
MVKMSVFEVHHGKNWNKTQDTFLKINLQIGFKKNGKVVSIKILVNMLDNPPLLELN